jgi:hypothetical protein
MSKIASEKVFLMHGRDKLGESEVGGHLKLAIWYQFWGSQI